MSNILAKFFLTSCFILFFLSMNALEVSVSTVKCTNSEGSYLEVYSRINSATIQWIADKDMIGTLWSNIEYSMFLIQNEKIVLADKYEISSSAIDTPKDFWDLKRLGVKEGEYLLKLLFKDSHNTSDSIEYLETINIVSEANVVQHSDILMLSSVSTSDTLLPFEKNGFYYEPLAYNLIDQNQKQLIFYLELYNSLLSFDEPYFLKYFIENTESTGLDAFSRTGYKKLKPEEFEALLVNFEISDLKSGNYILHIEINKKDRSLVKALSERFSVYNPYEDYVQTFSSDSRFETSFVQFLSEYELNYGLKAIFPRIGNNMTELVNKIISNKDVMPKRFFLYNFWSAFDPTNPKTIYEKYMEVAKAVDLTYANNLGTGFESHRGYYFLKYGKPDDMIYVEDEPTAPPYEIWIYNYLAETQQTNVRFLFYNPSLASNDFILLHSTCRGERNNPRWELELYSDAYQDQPNNIIDSRNMPDGFNRNARKIFDDF